MLSQQIGHNASPRANGVEGVLCAKFFATAAKIGFARFELALGVRIGNDAREQLKCPFDLWVLRNKVLSEQALVK
jgi:hypothetical protein